MDHDGNLISRKVTYSFIFISIVHSALKNKITPQGEIFIQKQIRSFLLLLTPFCIDQVIRKVIRRVSTPTPENQRGHGWRRDLQDSPLPQEGGSEQGDVSRNSRRKDDRRCAGSKFDVSWEEVFRGLKNCTVRPSGKRVQSATICFKQMVFM
ncbi:hypothetical protein INR49_013312 [Caranx melampygus]|nr:hypothetical protein INR49_013312 [Caranx melampygus]